MDRKRHGNVPEKDDFAEKQYWKWQWLRRNREYREDFDKYGKGLQKASEEYNNSVKAVIERGKIHDPPKSIAPFSHMTEGIAGKHGQSG